MTDAVKTAVTTIFQIQRIVVHSVLSGLIYHQIFYKHATKNAEI